ncbi:hypothetical protein CRE_10283 [Caenorhabditis remanei]|uniref:Uncharacterized protein n=3 Tax=Caenorhabditis TaxID=6237 RepID=E3M6A5_CAERE|nr:hypothetical protein CRE_13216 [Caenorhabditis remanei]EFO93017.1 hypothetical protein CRE_10283 [Caenorhabditis remanei]
MRVVKSAAGRSMITFVFATVFCSLMAKIMVTRYFFDYPVVILMMQSAATLFVIEVARVLGILKVAPYCFEKGRHIVIPSILYTISQWITVASFEGIAMPNFDSVKRFTPILILIGLAARCRQQKVDQNRTFIIIGLSIASAFAVNLDFSIDRYSLMYGMVGAVLQAAALILFEEHLQTYNYTEVLYMHSFNSLVFYLLADMVRDELRDAFMYMITSAHPLFIIVFAISMLSGVLFHFTAFSCLEKNGSLNMQIVSNIRAVAETFFAYYLSIYLFYDVYPGVLNWAFLAITLAAARALYSRDSEPEIVKGPWMTKA